MEKFTEGARDAAPTDCNAKTATTVGTSTRLPLGTKDATHATSASLEGVRAGDVTILGVFRARKATSDSEESAIENFGTDNNIFW